MAESSFERSIEVAGQTCQAILNETWPDQSWAVRVMLPDGRALKIPGLFQTEGQALMAASQRAEAVLRGA
jgi:hypothetical protein